MRRAHRIDANQPDIVAALRAAGATVCSLAGAADGMPDLMVGASGKTALIEVKDGSRCPSERRLTPDQRKWHAEWQGGTLAVVCDVESALRVLAVMRAGDEPATHSARVDVAA